MILSICVLTYNRRSLLEELLQSIFKSEVLLDGQVELVIMDNGSTDDTWKYLQSINDKRNIKLIRKEINVRGSLSYKELFSHSKGEWIIAPGDDDVFLFTELTRLPDYLQELEQTITLVPFAARTIDSTGKLTPVRHIPNSESDTNKLLAKLFFESIYWFPATCFRKRVLQSEKIPNTITVFDWWIWIQGVICGDVVPNKQELVCYRIHEGQEQHSFSETFWNIDKLETLLVFVEGRAFKNWISKSNESDIRTFLESISANQTSSIETLNKIILLRAGKLIVDSKPKFTGEVIELLIELGIDYRYVSQYFEQNLGEETLRLVLSKLTETSNRQILSMSGAEIENALIEHFKVKRVEEIIGTITPVEKKVLGLYRKVRSMKLLRWLIRR